MIPHQINVLIPPASTESRIQTQNDIINFDDAEDF